MSKRTLTASEEATRALYSSGTTYRPETISASFNNHALATFSDRLLQTKRQLLERHVAPGAVAVDLGCGNGLHLMEFADRLESGFGVDFSERFLRYAAAEAARRGHSNLSFFGADLCQLPLPDHCADLVWSFATLYHVERIEQAIAAVERVLKVGGTAILEFGNAHSLNAAVGRAYPDIAKLSSRSTHDIRKAFDSSSLEIIEWRSFQITPMWGGRPRWLRPLLSEGWKRFMLTPLHGQTLDEWISSLPVLRAFAFRHLLTCRGSAS